MICIGNVYNDLDCANNPWLGLVETLIMIGPFFYFRLMMTIFCNMDHTLFPFDVQTCNITMFSCKFFSLVSYSDRFSIAMKSGKVVILPIIKHYYGNFLLEVYKRRRSLYRRVGPLQDGVIWLMKTIMKTMVYEGSCWRWHLWFWSKRTVEIDNAPAENKVNK